MALDSIRPRDVAGYTRAALSGDVLQWPDGSPRPASAKTVQLHLNVLHDPFKSARAEELVESNPVEGAERPKIGPRRWRILEPVEIRSVASKFGDEQARSIFLTLVLTGLRRFELQALRWRDVESADLSPDLGESLAGESGGFGIAPEVSSG
jgi:integrase